MEIKDSVFLITGANRGIGRAVAQMAAKSKAHLILANRTLDAEIEKDLLSAGAASVEQVQVDLLDKNKIADFVESMKFKNIDILFNNAGQLTGGLLETQNLEQIYSMLQVNINAVIQLTHGLLPGMVERKKGKIIINSSVAAVMNFPCASTYSASKAAVLAFARSLQGELKGSGVTSLVLITPGIETRMFNEIPKLYGKNLEIGNLLKSIPASKYAMMIREAIVEDFSELRPQGLRGLGVFFAQHLPQIFDRVVSQRFKR